MGLLQEFSKEDNFGDELDACNTLEEAYELATSRVGGYSLEEFRQLMIRLKETAVASSGISEDSFLVWAK